MSKADKMLSGLLFIAAHLKNHLYFLFILQVGFTEYKKNLIKGGNRKPFSFYARNKIQWYPKLKFLYSIIVCPKLLDTKHK